MISMSSETLVDGISSEFISINNRGLCYGDGLFETIKVQRAVPEFFDLHLQRLSVGCKKLDIECDEFALRKEVAQILGDCSYRQATLKIMVTRGDTPRGYGYTDNLPGHRIITLSEFTHDYEEQQRYGVKTIICQTQLAANSVVAGLKHLNRLENVIARAEWADPTIAEGLLFDSDDRLVEGVMSNVFLVKNGELHTPSLSGSGVAGIIRHVIMEALANELKLAVSVCSISRDRLAEADEVFLCNSIIGIWPVIAINERSLAVGKITRMVQESLARRTVLDE